MDAVPPATMMRFNSATLAYRHRRRYSPKANMTNRYTGVAVPVNHRAVAAFAAPHSAPSKRNAYRSGGTAHSRMTSNASRYLFRRMRIESSFRGPDAGTTVAPF